MFRIQTANFPLQNFNSLVFRVEDILLSERKNLIQKYILCYFILDLFSDFFFERQ